MRNVFLSIIIPSYNPDVNLLKKCVNSLRTLVVSHEIIIVDDGSYKDISKECEQYFEGIDNTCYIRQAHGGVSSARNLGIELSTGQYVFFLDSDDEISADMVDFINTNYKSMSADWVLCGITVRYRGSSKVKHRTIVSEKIIDSNKENIFSLEYKDILQTRIASKELNESCGKFIKRSVIIQNKVTFPVGVLNGEDSIFNTRLLQVICDIQYIPIYGYIYNYIPKSADRLLVDPYKKYELLSEGEQELATLINNRALEEKKKYYFRRQKAMVVLNLTQDCFILYRAGKLDEKMKYFLVAWMRDNKLFEDLRIGDCEGLKLKVYYIIVKYRMWNVIALIAEIKKLLNK